MRVDLQPLLAYIPMDRRQAISQGKTLPDRAYGTALFADISGFTPLTEALVRELGRRRSAEELTRQLNTVYGALISKVHRYSGCVISFSGDAITCWFSGDEGLLATACALSMQQVMAPFAQVQTPGGTTVSLAIKVALTTGPVRRFLVGDPQIQYIDVLAGATLDHMAAAERQAEKGEVVVGPAAMANLKKKVIVRDWREDDTGNRYAVVDAVTSPITLATPWPTLPANAFTEEQVRPWLLPPVYEQLRIGQGQFLAELRPAATLFLRFTGLDYDGDNDAGEKLDNYMRWVQNVLANYEAYMLQLTVGDKGSYLYAAFGAPIAHDDDTVRAVAAAVELRSPPPELSYITGIQIGISQGRMRTGAYGSQTRRTYGVLGDEVNTSARLMSKAAPGQILVSPQVAEVAATGYTLKYLGEFLLKGKQEPLPVSEVIERRQPSSQRPSTLYTSPLVGREDELIQMGQWLEVAFRGEGQVLRLEGVAGIGKSHLSAEFSERAIGHGFHVVVGACQSTSQGTLYYPWRQIFRAFFNLGEETTSGSDDMATITARHITQVETIIQQTNPDWQLRLPLLGDLLGLPISDNAVTATFDPRLRQEVLFTLVSEIVQIWAQEQPLLLLLEDVHWMDEASLGLTVALSRAITALPVLLMLVHRPPLRSDKPLLPELDSLPYHRYGNLSELSPTGVAALVANRLHGQPSPLVLSLIQGQAHGNPFFIEELVDALREAGHLQADANGIWILSQQMMNALRDANCLVRENGQWLLATNASLSAADLDIPDSIHGAVLSRIDRLPEADKLTLKVASVIGRMFETVLLEHAHPARPTPEALQEQISNIEARDFIRLEIPPPQLTYIFKHSTTQEVTYDTLLFAQRRALHRTVARWYEQTFSDTPSTATESPLAPYYPLLAYHWRQAEDAEKECYYAQLAGEQAAAQFANEEAIAFLSRALDLAPQHNSELRYNLLLGREAVYGLVGQRDAQANDLIQLQDLAEKMKDDHRRAEVALRFANYYEATSDFSAALLAAQQAVQMTEKASAVQQKVKGLIAKGRALWRQGTLEAARTNLIEALHLARQHGNRTAEATSLHLLGTVLYYLGEHEKARDRIEHALMIRRDLGDILGESTSLNNLVGVYHALGDLGRAKEYSGQALAIYQTIGEQRGKAHAYSNLGVMNHTLGLLDTARQDFERALELYQSIGDQAGEALVANNLSLIFHDLGDSRTALRFCRQAITISRTIGDREGEGYGLTSLGLALESLEALEAAKDAYMKALRLRREIGQGAAAVDDLAGLARVYLKKGRLSEALRYTEEALSWIDSYGTGGIEYPLRVHLTAIDVLAEAGQSERAGNILKAAHTLLLERASRISDEKIRLAFLEGVPLHQQLRQRLSQQKNTVD